jgi:hypothetical protein
MSEAFACKVQLLVETTSPVMAISFLLRFCIFCLHQTPPLVFVVSPFIPYSGFGEQVAKPFFAFKPGHNCRHNAVCAPSTADLRCRIQCVSSYHRHSASMHVSNALLFHPHLVSPLYILDSSHANSFRLYRRTWQ